MAYIQSDLPEKKRETISINKRLILIDPRFVVVSSYL